VSNPSPERGIQRIAADNTYSVKSIRYIPTLDGWRALAIIGVLICHASGYFFARDGVVPNSRIYAFLFHGALGVDVFFVLSGFLICAGLAREEDASSTISLKAFYVRRALRILPPYLCYLVAISTLSALGRLSVSHIELLACFAFFRNFVHGGTAGWYTAHFWTLAIEEHFYLFLPAFMIVTGNKRRAVWIFSAFATATVFRVFNSNGQLLGQLASRTSFNALGENQLNELILGAWLATMVRNIRFREWVQQIPILACLLPLVLIVYSTARPIPGYELTFPLAIGSLIVFTALNPHSLLGKFLEYRPIQWIGRASYSLYLWQQLFFVLDVPRRALPLGSLQRWPLAPLAVAGCAILSYFVVEQPCIRLGRRLSTRIRSTSANPA
jgi:peptidoglycan/LPS O-acetylase OafA/YrhL